MKLLIIDSEQDLVEMLVNWLKTRGYQVYRAYTGEHARLEWQQQQPDLVIIDPVLQDMDGMSLWREMRIKHDALIMVITDSKNVQDEIRCLESGADDYLQKPFRPTQLLAHLHAISRRGRSTLAQRPSSIVTIGTLQVDSLRNEVSIDGKTTRLTPTESKLLHLLAVNANHVCTADQIVSYIWGFDNDGDVRLIKAHIRHLRKKIERDPSHPAYIQTISGVGYTLTNHCGSEDHYGLKHQKKALQVVSH